MDHIAGHGFDPPRHKQQKNLPCSQEIWEDQLLEEVASEVGSDYEFSVFIIATTKE